MKSLNTLRHNASACFLLRSLLEQLALPCVPAWTISQGISLRLLVPNDAHCLERCSMNKPRSRKRRFAFVLLAMSFSMVLFALVAEIGLRLAHISSPGYYQPDPFLASTLRPGTRGWWTKEGHAWVQINSRGMHDVERTVAKPLGTLRVAVLGDSYIEAMQVALHDNLCQQLEHRLNQSSSAPVEVLNFGVSGYGTAQQYLKLEHEAWKYDPDVVVLCLYPGNDLRNNSRDLEPEKMRPFFTMQNGELTLENSFQSMESYLVADSQYEKWKAAIVNRSALLQFLKKLKASLSGLQPPAEQTSPVDQIRHAVEDSLYVYREPVEESQQQAWTITEEILSKFVSSCEQKDVPAVIAVLSTSLQAYPDEQVRQQICDEFNIDNQFYAVDRLKSWAENRPVSLVDLAAPLQQYANANNVFLHGFENSGLGYGHWNEHGHLEAANVLAKPIGDLLKQP